MRHVLRVTDLTRDEVVRILDSAGRFARERRGTAAQGRVLVSAFFEPSTRTRLSFEAAMHRLGGTVVGFASPEGTSLAKGERFTDTARMLAASGDLIVIRHPARGSAALAAQVSGVPVINAGDGANEHPTQALVDVYALKARLGRIDGITVAVAGDAHNARATNSLIKMLGLLGCAVIPCSPPGLEPRPEILEEARRLGGKIHEPVTVEDAVAAADALYVTRLQSERLPSGSHPGLGRITLSTLRNAKPDMPVLHPLPRVDELALEIDATRHAAYFEQARAGVPVRMAILEFLIQSNTGGR